MAQSRKRRKKGVEHLQAAQTEALKERLAKKTIRQYNKRHGIVPAPGAIVAPVKELRGKTASFAAIDEVAHYKAPSKPEFTVQEVDETDMPVIINNP